MRSVMKVAAVAMAGALALAACGSSSSGGGSSAGATPSASKSDVKVGMAYDIGGRGDKSFNDAAAAGLDKASKEFGVSTKELSAVAGETDAQKTARLELLAAHIVAEADGADLDRPLAPPIALHRLRRAFECGALALHGAPVASQPVLRQPHRDRRQPGIERAGGVVVCDVGVGADEAVLSDLFRAAGLTHHHQDQPEQSSLVAAHQVSERVTIAEAWRFHLVVPVAQRLDRANGVAQLRRALEPFGRRSFDHVALQRADELVLTEIQLDVEGDTFFPAFERSDFEEVAREESRRSEDGTAFSFVTYARRPLG